MGAGQQGTPSGNRHSNNTTVGAVGGAGQNEFGARPRRRRGRRSCVGGVPGRRRLTPLWGAPRKLANICRFWASSVRHRMPQHLWMCTQLLPPGGPIFGTLECLVPAAPDPQPTDPGGGTPALEFRLVFGVSWLSDSDSLEDRVTPLRRPGAMPAGGWGLAG